MARKIKLQKAHFFISGNGEHSFIESNNPSVRDYVLRIIEEKPQCDAVLSDVYQYLSDENVNTLQTYAEQANNPFTLKRLHEMNQATRWLSKPLSNRPEHVCNEYLRRCGSGRYLPTGSQRRFSVSHQHIPPKIAGEIAAFIPRD